MPSNEDSNTHKILNAIWNSSGPGTLEELDTALRALVELPVNEILQVFNGMGVVHDEIDIEYITPLYAAVIMGDDNEIRKGRITVVINFMIAHVGEEGLLEFICKLEVDKQRLPKVSMICHNDSNVPFLSSLLYCGKDLFLLVLGCFPASIRYKLLLQIYQTDGKEWVLSILSFLCSEVLGQEESDSTYTLELFTDILTLLPLPSRKEALLYKLRDGCPVLHVFFAIDIEQAPALLAKTLSGFNPVWF